MEHFMTYGFLEMALWIKIAFVAIFALHTIFTKGIWHRLLGINLFGIKIVMVMIAFASMEGITFLLDMAILLTLFDFMATIFVALFIMRLQNSDRKLIKLDVEEIKMYRPKTENKDEGGVV